MVLGVSMVCLVVLSAVNINGALGFIVHNTPETQTPADAIVQVALEELDTDKDGKIAISEVQGLINEFYNSNLPGFGGRGRPVAMNSRNAEMIGYLMTFANMADGDASGFIEMTEIQRFASLLVSQAGDVQVGRVVEFAAMVNERIHGHRYLPETSRSQITHGIDRNSDGTISHSEKEELIQLRRNRWWRQEIEESFQTADVNADGLLNTEETTEWISQLVQDSPLLLRDLIVYYRIVAIAGRDVADIWAQTTH